MSDHGATLEFPRQYLPTDARFNTWEAAQQYYEELLARPINTPAEFEKWMLDFSELDSVFDEEGTARQIASTQATNDPEREQAFLDFIQNIQPHVQPWHFKLREKFIECMDRFDLPKKRWEVLDRKMRTINAIYREENIPLEVENAELGQQFQKVTGTMSVTYQGREMTIEQLAPYLQDPDRAVREETYRVATSRYLQDAEVLDGIYAKMIQLRHQMAENADCGDFRNYMFKAYNRFDYTPDDCIAFHDAIERVVVPAVSKLAEQRKAALGLDTLRPWDLDVDIEGRPPLRPFETEDELIAGCQKIFDQVHPELGAVFATLNKRGMLDLSSRQGKAPGGYQAVYDEKRMPFIFMNAVGTEDDIRTLLHEGGHAFHSWACRNDPILSYRHYPIEFAEVASMGMECLALPYTKAFYGDEDARARKRFFKKIVEFFPYMAMVDGLQHYVYTHVGVGIEAIKDEWVRLQQRFMPHVDYTGLEPFVRHGWHRKLHFFLAPFYYIEYGIAQLGALQVWTNSRRDYAEAVAMYRNALALGGSRPLPELFETAGAKFDFSEATLRPLIDAAMEEVSG